LTKKTVGPDVGAAAAMPTGGNRQRRFVQLQVCRGESAAQIFRRTWAGLSRPGRKIHPGDTLTKRRWFRPGGRSVGIGSADKIGKVGRIGSRC